MSEAILDWRPSSHEEFVGAVQEGRVRLNVGEASALKRLSEVAVPRGAMESEASYCGKLLKSMASSEEVYRVVFDEGGVDMILRPAP